MSNNNGFEQGNAWKPKQYKNIEQNTHPSEDENFCLEYAESLVEGDIRPYVLKDYKKEK